VRIIWSQIAQATFVRVMADQAGMMAVNRAVAALADDPAPPGAFVCGAYRRLRVGPYRVLYEVEGDLITIVRIEPAISRRPPIRATDRREADQGRAFDFGGERHLIEDADPCRVP